MVYETLLVDILIAKVFIILSLLVCFIVSRILQKYLNHLRQMNAVDQKLNLVMSLELKIVAEVFKYILLSVSYRREIANLYNILAYMRCYWRTICMFII